MKHTLLHLLGCLLPLLLIFLLPLFGVGEGITLFVFILLMFGCHLFMMRGHSHEGEQNQPRSGGHTHEHH